VEVSFLVLSESYPLARKYAIRYFPVICNGGVLQMIYPMTGCSFSFSVSAIANVAYGRKCMQEENACRKETNKEGISRKQHSEPISGLFKFLKAC
jgi:hypothetical protein